MSNNYHSIPNSPPKYSESSPINKNQHSPKNINQSNSPYLNTSNFQSNSPYPSNDIPEDFQYGVTVGQSDVEIRMAFVRKVYFILVCQLGLTSLMAGLFSFEHHLNSFIFRNQWIPIVAALLSIANLFALIWKRHSYPTNFGLLISFTFLESLSLGTIISFYDTIIVLQALLVTLGIFISLTLIAMQSKYDFSSWEPHLIMILWGLILVGVVQIFIPFNSFLDLGVAIVSALIFSGLILVDTQNIMSRVSPDEYILASVELYLDFINLFINILRILQYFNSNNDN